MVRHNLLKLSSSFTETIDKAKREIMFIQMLEGLQAEEAKLLLNVKNKNLQTVYSGLTSELVREAFGWNDQFTKTS